jgi:5-methylcytosine-specific restriction protein A
MERVQAYKREQKNTTSYRLYRSAAWRNLRLDVLRNSEKCKTVGCASHPTVVDHIVPHKGDQTLFFDRANLQPLCKSCHDRKTAKQDGGFGRTSKHGAADYGDGDGFGV